MEELHIRNSNKRNTAGMNENQLSGLKIKSFDSPINLPVDQGTISINDAQSLKSRLSKSRQ